MDRLKPKTDAARAGRAAWLTRLAFGLSAALVLARATMLETLRNPLDVFPNSAEVPRGPGAGTGLVLDLLACAPAVLVLFRRVVDPSFPIRFAGSFVPMALLAAWAAASVAWAGDRFAAAVSSFHWLAASVLLWATAQSVRDWAHLRLVAAVCFGLLLVQLGEGFYRKYVEFPELLAQWEKSKDEFLSQRGWEPGSFQAMQFERRVASGEIMGFTSSENSYGAVVVLLAVVAAGVCIQRVSDRDHPGFAAVAGAGVAAALAMIAHLRSRTAYATPVLAAALLGALYLLRGWIGRRERLCFAIGVCAVVMAAAAVVGHGLRHGSLPGDSLSFRWNYWTASARLFLRHPLLGVGWENFGPHYLSVRLPAAAEEIKDPHNLVVRFATELGLVGLALLLAWMLWLWWDMTAPRTPIGGERVRSDLGEPPMKTMGPGAGNVRMSGAVGAAMWIGAGGVSINLLGAVDWSQSTVFVALELMRRACHLCLFVVGAAIVALRSAERQELDGRPAPWVLYGTLAGLGLFLVHNLVDFSLFEPGPMTLFMFLCGAGLGTRMAPAPNATGRSRLALGGFVAAAIAWAGVAAVFVVPVVLAEQAAHEGDQALRLRAFDRAASEYERAGSTVGYNADYAYRAGRALLYAPDPRPQAGRVLALLDRAVAADPGRAEYWLTRANAELLRPAPDPAVIRRGYDRALMLDPNSVQVRLDYAAMLQRLGDPAGAREQYAAALKYNDLLDPDEPKRLSAEKLEEVRKAISELRG